MFCNIFDQERRANLRYERTVVIYTRIDRKV